MPSHPLSFRESATPKISFREPRIPEAQFPRRPLSVDLVSELIRRRYPIKECAHPTLDHPEHKLEEVLVRCGILKRSRVDRLVSRISVQLLDNPTCLLVPAPQVARCRARFANPIVERGEVDIERLRRRTVRPRLHEFGVRREALWGVYTHKVCRIDNRLLLNALHVVEGLGDRPARYRPEHGLGVGDVSALSPYPCHFVASPLPQTSEPATPATSPGHDHLREPPRCSVHQTPPHSR